MALIEVKNLTKIYSDDGNKTPALRGVSFSVSKNEYLAVVGPSGSGKSTLLHILGFLDEPTSGDYLFEGKKFNNYSEKQKARLRNKKIGFVFQTYNLLARTNVLENVKLPLLYSDVSEKQWESMALEAIKSVGLSHRLKHKPSQLSGGERQRVAIARAMVTDPQIILADEPTGNLDSKSSQVVMEYLNRFYSEGRTIILITHEAHIADYASRIIKIKDGQIESDKRV